MSMLQSPAGKESTNEEIEEAKSRIKKAETFVRETLKARHEAEMITLSWIEKLLDNVTAECLKLASRYLRPQDYDEVVNERNLASDCGFPVCSNKRTQPSARYKISMSEKKIYSLERLSKFCSMDHLRHSMFYRSQLSDEPIWTREGINTLPPGEAKWESCMKLYGEGNPEDILKGPVLEEVRDLKKDYNIVERSPAMDSIDDNFDESTADTVEGYISRFAELAQVQAAHLPS